MCKRLHKIPEDPSDPNVEQAALVNQMYEIAKVRPCTVLYRYSTMMKILKRYGRVSDST